MFLPRSLPRALISGVFIAAWLLGSLLGIHHNTSVVHAVCAEHQEIVELRPDTGDHEDKSGKPDPGTQGIHDHGCELPSFAAEAVSDAPEAAPELVDVPAASTLSVVLLQAPRPPPLSYAPKTSPPARSV